MHTYFAPAERIPPEELNMEFEIVSNSPVMSGLLNSVSGLLAVLDEHRQILALNDSFTRMLGIKDTKEAFGMGTFSMKLFGEQILGGRISFKSSKTDGTTFTFVLPALK